MKKQPPKYDTSSALKKLREAGVSQRQAEAHVEIISDILENVATKADLKQMENSLIAKIDQGNKLLLQQMSSMKNSIDMQMNFMKDEFSQQMEFQITDNNEQVTSLKEGFGKQVNTLKEELSQQMNFMNEELNQKMEKYFYKLLVLFPIVCVSLLAVYDYLKDKFS